MGEGQVWCASANDIGFFGACLRPIPTFSRRYDTMDSICDECRQKQQTARARDKRRRGQAK